ncbi:MAG: SCO family protein [Alphaproteobacteria bacterium]|nr:SCO family protein [Alphaproteobacteria bacterium]
MSQTVIRRLLMIAFAATAFLLAALVGRLWFGPAMFGNIEVGTPLVGGPFTLTDQSGRTVTDQTFRGKFMLIYFGYTFCPDFCPTSLQIMAEALEQIGPVADRVQPMLITVDPARDTVEQLASYVPSFGERMMGLTGTPEQIAAAARAYRVYYKKAQIEGLADYGMDHSSIIYLMGPDGRYLTHFSHQATPEQVAAGIRKHL